MNFPKGGRAVVAPRVMTALIVDWQAASPETPLLWRAWTYWGARIDLEACRKHDTSRSEWHGRALWRRQFSCGAPV